MSHLIFVFYGYAKGYTYEWNTLISTTQSQPPSIQTQPQNTTTPTGPSLDTLYNKGIDLYHRGNYTGAIEYFDKILAINPKYIAALREKGNVLLALENYTGAMLYYDRVLAINPTDRHALNNEGVALNSLGSYTGALEFYNKALTIDPNNTFALTNKDVILHMSENATNFLQYENSTYGIKMQYPSDWHSVEGASNSSIVASFNPQRNYTSYVAVQIENLSTGYTPDQYLNTLMLGDAADYKDFPDVRFNQNTTNNIVLAGYPEWYFQGSQF